MATFSNMYRLKWQNHSNQLLEEFEDMRQTSELFDVTIACEGRTLKAHQVVLSACSPYFRSLFRSNPCPHPIVHMKDTAFEDIKVLLDFVYRGEADASQSQIQSVIETAKSLQIKGLGDTFPPTQMQTSTPVVSEPQQQQISPRSKRKRTRRKSTNYGFRKDDVKDSSDEYDSDDLQDSYKPSKRDSYQPEYNMPMTQYQSPYAQPQQGVLVEEPEYTPEPMSEQDLQELEDPPVEQMVDISELQSFEKVDSPSTSQQVYDRSASQSTSSALVRKRSSVDDPRSRSSTRSLSQDSSRCGSSADVKPEPKEDASLDNSALDRSADSGGSSQTPSTSKQVALLPTSGAVVSDGVKGDKDASHCAEKKEYRCGSCSYSSCERTNLNRHLLTHTGDLSYKSLEFKKSEDIFVIEDETIHQCRYCAYSSTSETELEQHTLAHTEDWVHKCEHCGRSFALLANLKSHLLVHKRKFSFNCFKCGKSFDHIHHLTEHERYCTYH